MSDDEGKTLRDEFALAALTGLCADPEMDAPPVMVAWVCYGLADAMMAERNGEEVLRRVVRGKVALRSVGGDPG